MNSQALLVITTCASPVDAGRLADMLVESRLAACVSRINSVSSTYRWQGKIQQDHESLLLIKTTAERYTELEQALCEHSTYDVPEILAVPVQNGLPAYLEWLATEVGPDAS